MDLRAYSGSRPLAIPVIPPPLSSPSWRIASNMARCLSAISRAKSARWGGLIGIVGVLGGIPKITSKRSGLCVDTLAHLHQRGALVEVHSPEKGQGHSCRRQPRDREQYQHY